MKLSCNCVEKYGHYGTIEGMQESTKDFKKSELLFDVINLLKQNPLFFQRGTEEQLEECRETFMDSLEVFLKKKCCQAPCMQITMYVTNLTTWADNTIGGFVDAGFSVPESFSIVEEALKKRMNKSQNFNSN